MSARVRLAPGTRRDVGVAVWGFAAVAGRVSGTEPPRLFLTLGRNRRLFWGWLRFARHLMPSGRLPRRETELVILRVAAATGCEYERGHHERLARRAGLSADDVARAALGSSATGWTERERAVLGATDSLLDTDDFDDDAWERLRAHLAAGEIVELVMLVGHYRMLATVIRTLGIEPDGPAAAGGRRR